MRVRCFKSFSNIAMVSDTEMPKLINENRSMQSNNKQNDSAAVIEKSWYAEDKLDRLSRIQEEGNKLANLKKITMESADRYAMLKKSFRDSTNVAVTDGAISKSESFEHLADLNRIDSEIIDKINSDRRKHQRQKNINLRDGNIQRSRRHAQRSSKHYDQRSSKDRNSNRRSKK